MRTTLRWLAVAANVVMVANVAHWAWGRAQANGAAWEMDLFGVSVGAAMMFAVNGSPSVLALLALLWPRTRQPN